MRYQYLDILRWIAILLMILFHLNYSLVYIFENNILNFSETFWFVLGKTSALWFMIISGVSFFLAREKYGDEIRKKYIKYAGILALIALWITIWTALFMSSQLIVFGILHLFAVSFFLLPFIAKLEYFSGFLAIILIASWAVFPLMTNIWWLFPVGIISPEFYSADYYPLIPYFWYILLWFFVWKCMQKYKLFRYLSLWREMNALEKVLRYMGRNSLVIYVLHQPIIIASLCILFSILRP